MASSNEIFFLTGEENTYAIIDGAACEELLDKLDEFDPEYVCLYAGELDSDIAECAPYLVKLEPESNFTNWLFDEGWGKHWGIYAQSQSDLKILRGHFRRFLQVKGPESDMLYFRFYDPRVLRDFLPHCDPEHAEQMFGPVTTFYAETANAMLVMNYEFNTGSVRVASVVVDNK